jgi:P27 family predicted phage terminase small subunit
MTPGRAPIPTALKIAAGNPGHRPINADEPAPPAAVPRCPAHLTGAAREEWKKRAPALAKLGLLTTLDTAALEMLCAAYGEWREAMAEMAKSKPVLKTSGGNLIQHPYLAIANRARADYLRFAIQFGFTPSARTRIKATMADAEGDDFEGPPL